MRARRARVRAAGVLAAAVVAGTLAARTRALDPPLAEQVRAAAEAPGGTAERAARVRALGPEGIAALLADPSLATAARELLGPVLDGMADGEVRRLAAGWLEGGGGIFERALASLDEKPRAGLVEPLLCYLASTPADPRAAAVARARLDGIVESAGIEPLLAAAAEDPPLAPAVRAALAAALGRSGRPEAVAALAAIARDVTAGMARRTAALALADIADPRNAQVAPLLALLAEGEDDALLVASAASALGRLRASEAVPALIGVLGSGDGGARQAAHAALCEIAGRSLPPDAAAWRAAWDAERARAERDLPLVLLELESGDPAVTIRAMREAASFVAARERVRPALLVFVAGESPGLRAAACAALGQLDDPAAVPALVAALDDPDPGVWDAAWRALRRITGKDLPAKSAAWRRRGADEE
jgi:HEAT repeat protein